MRTEDMDAATVAELHKRICWLMTNALTDAPDKANYWAWTVIMVLGYLQTDHGLHHPSGEDASGWREDCARVGIEVPDFDKPERDRLLKRLGELKAPAIVDAAIKQAKGAP